MRPPAPIAQLRDLELLLEAHHPLLFLETAEEDRAEVLLEHVAEHLDLLYLKWTPLRGLSHPMMKQPLEGTVEARGCLEHIARSTTESLYHLADFSSLLDDIATRASLKEAHRALWKHRGAMVITGPSITKLPDSVRRLATTVVLSPPSDEEYHRFLSDVLRDLRQRRRVRMDLDAKDVGLLIQQLRGLTFFEV
ncbi:MAG: hypothetical protein AAGA56_14080, partial [Myxococcota bacterium]